MKFVKALEKIVMLSSICKNIPNITEGKLIIVGPQIRKIMKDSQFESILYVN